MKDPSIHLNSNKLVIAIKAMILSYFSPRPHWGSIIVGSQSSWDPKSPAVHWLCPDHLTGQLTTAQQLHQNYWKLRVLGLPTRILASQTHLGKQHKTKRHLEEHRFKLMWGKDFAPWDFQILSLPTSAWMPSGWHCTSDSLSQTSNPGVIQPTSLLPSSSGQQANNSLAPGSRTDNPFKITGWVMPTSYPEQIQVQFQQPTNNDQKIRVELTLSRALFLTV